MRSEVVSVLLEPDAQSMLHWWTRAQAAWLIVQARELKPAWMTGKPR